MSRNSGNQKCFFVIYPETNKVEMKYFKESYSSNDESISRKHADQSVIETAICSDND